MWAAPLRLLSQARPSSVLPATPSALQTAPVRPRAAADEPINSNLGKARANTYRRRFIGTLARRVQVWPRQHPQCTQSRAKPVRRAKPCLAAGGFSDLLAMTIRIALYQPDIPQNTGTILRLCACLGIEAHIIEPAGFPISDRAFRRAGMDYLDAVSITRHASWSDFDAWRKIQHAGQLRPCRLVVFTTSATLSYLDYRFETGRHLAVRTRKRGRTASRPCRRRRPAVHPDASRPAFAQCRDRRRDGRGRSVAADRRAATPAQQPAAR